MSFSSQIPNEQLPTADAYIAVMGVTGAGKSTFISQFVNEHVQIGNGLRSCTETCTFFLSGYTTKDGRTKKLCLIDTPGFDDTDRSDRQVLEQIASNLGEAYKENVKLSGIIYLHRITDNRLSGSALKNLQMFRKLCGEDAFKNVILATTMWESVDESLGASREQELINTREWWGGMYEKGSSIHRHYNTNESAFSVLGKILDRPEEDNVQIPLQIQTEMIDKNKNLDETSAGQEMDKNLIQQKQLHKKEIDTLRRDIQDALKAKDEENARELRAQENLLQAKLTENERSQSMLRVNYNDLLQRVRDKEEEVEQNRVRESEIRALQNQNAEQNRLRESEIRALQNQNAELHKAQAQRERETQEAFNQLRDQAESNKRKGHDIYSCTDHWRCRMARRVDRKMNH